MKARLVSVVEFGWHDWTAEAPGRLGGCRPEGEQKQGERAWIRERTRLVWIVYEKRD